MSSFTLASIVTVEDIEESTDDPRDDILEIMWAKDGQNILEENCQLSRYFSGYAIYVRISCLKNSNPFNVSIDSIMMNMKIFGGLHNTLGPCYGIRFVDTEGLPEPDFTSYFIIDNKLGAFPIVATSYTKTITRSLEEPYETKCRYYDKVRSIYECVMNSSLKQKNPFLFPTMVYEWGKYPSNKIDGKIYPGMIQSKRGIVLLETPRTPIMYFKAYPKLQWSEYLIFVGSILGIWFGFSVSGQLIKSIQFIKSRSTKMKQKSEFENEIEPVILSNTKKYWNQLANQKGRQTNDKILWASSKYRRNHLRSRY